ncbi:hypothetical protein [Thiolapillus sp.]
MQHKFDIYFSGEILEGRDEQQVRETVGKLFKLSGDKLDSLFSGTPRRIKKDLNVEQSGRFRETFRKAGAIVQIVAAGTQPPEKTSHAATRPGAASPSGLKLAPVGSNLDPLPREAERGMQKPLPQTTTLEIAPIGPVPAGPDPRPADIDTGTLAAAPAESGSLEEFTPAVEPVPLPDISNLNLAKDNHPLQEDREKHTDNIPDTSHLEAVPPRTGSLEKFAQHKKPAPIPDISNLSLDG